MGDVKTYTRSFNGGVMTSEFFGQVADPKFQTGLATCRNFIVSPHGPVGNRPGTRFVRFQGNEDYKARLLPFYFSFSDTRVVEFGHLYFRFHTFGGTILDGPDPYELEHPYTYDELAAVQFTQSGDVITLTHGDHPIRELRRLTATTWELIDLAVGPSIAAPVGLGGVATPGSTPGAPFDTLYVVTAVLGNTDESLQSATTTVSNNLYDDGAYNTLNWTAMPTADRFNVYKKSAGLFGYIGQTEDNSFKDENIAPDPGRTPPKDVQLFDAADKYPRTCFYYEQRRGFAAWNEGPQNAVLSKSGTESNFNYSIPNQDADSLQFKVASRGGDAILHGVPLEDLILTTRKGLWKVSGGAVDILLPDTITVKFIEGIGASDVPPVVAGNMLYVAASGGHIREFGYNGDKGGYSSGDICVRAPHLFDGYDITRLAFSVSPFPIVWAVSTSGNLIGCTYLPEQQIGAMHEHDTKGVFEDVVVVTEDGRDAIYALVKRELGGETRRCVERFDQLQNRNFTNLAEAYFVDCGATYDAVLEGDPDGLVTSVSGLDWLEGETVSILADGCVIPPQEVVDGTITLSVPAELVQIGLGYNADLETLPVVLETEAWGQLFNKNINEVYLKVRRSSGVAVGPRFDKLTPHKQRTIEPLGSPPEPVTGTIAIKITPSWDADGSICLRQSDPLPLTVLALGLDLALGGG